MSRKRGRPPKDFVTDLDRVAVAMLDAQLRFAALRPGHKGKQPSKWHAAQMAVMRRDEFEITDPVRFDEPPPRERVDAKSQRFSPKNPNLQGGYDERTVVSKKLPKRTGALYMAAADRIRKKHAAWRKNEAARQWLSKQSFEFAKDIYPQIPIADLEDQHKRTR